MSNISNTFKNYVSSKDLISIRSVLLDSLFIDKTFSKYNENLTYAKNNGCNVFENHNNRELILDKSKWSKDYLTKLSVELSDNFSIERVEHMKQVIISVNGKPTSKPVSKPTPTPTKTTSQPNNAKPISSNVNNGSRTRQVAEREVRGSSSEPKKSDMGLVVALVGVAIVIVVGVVIAVS